MASLITNWFTDSKLFWACATEAQRHATIISTAVPASFCRRLRSDGRRCRGVFLDASAPLTILICVSFDGPLRFLCGLRRAAQIRAARSRASCCLNFLIVAAEELIVIFTAKAPLTGDFCSATRI